MSLCDKTTGYPKPSFINFLSRLLLRCLLPRKQEMIVHCSGIRLREVNGHLEVHGWCFKEIRFGDAIKLDYNVGAQHHELYFCCFSCLDSFRRWVSV